MSYKLGARATKTANTENSDRTITSTTTTFKGDGGEITETNRGMKRASCLGRRRAPSPGTAPKRISGNKNNTKRSKSPLRGSTGSMKRAISSCNMKCSSGGRNSSDSMRLRRVSSFGSMKRSKSASSLQLFPRDDRGSTADSERRGSSFRSSLSLSDMVTGVKQELIKILGKGHTDDADFAAKTSRAIPCHIVLIASQDDKNQSQEGSGARSKYELPAHVGSSDWGSLATSAFVKLLHENPKKVIADACAAAPLNCKQVIMDIQERVRSSHRRLQEANPVISSSRPLGPPAFDKNKKREMYAPFFIVPPGHAKGKRRALLISVVSGEGPDLNAPPNDVSHLHYWLTTHGGFKEEDITILRDDNAAKGKYEPSTRKNILEGFAQLAKDSKPKDVCFIQFSGHGGRHGDDLYINPTDYKTNGSIMDYQILRDLTKNLPAKTFCTMLVDCCYSGCIGDLPYSLHSKGSEDQEIDAYYDTDTRQEMIQNEGNVEHQQRREARKKWRNITRITTAAKSYAKEMAQDINRAQRVAEALDKLKEEGSQSCHGADHRSSTSSTNSRDQENTKPNFNDNDDDLQNANQRVGRGRGSKPDPALDKDSKLASKRKSRASRSPPPPRFRFASGSLPRNFQLNSHPQSYLPQVSSKDDSKLVSKKVPPPRRLVYKSILDEGWTSDDDDIPARPSTNVSKRSSPPKAKSLLHSLPTYN